MINPMAPHAVSVLVSLGWERVHACGAVANLEVESGLAPKALGDHGTAHGICQWHPDRVEAIVRGMGIDVRTAGLDQQLHALDWEMRHTQTEALAEVGKSTTAFAAGYAFCEFYERPANLHQQATMRGNLADELFRSLAA